MSKLSALDEQKLMTALWSPQIADDLERFVLFCFPWGKENTPLHDKKGPRTWQRDELQAITEHIRNNKLKKELGVEPDVYKSAVASGRGVGKSALTSWLVYWFMSTRLGSTSVVTANTESQLKSRTWAELGKWHTLAINSHWFDRQALSLKPTDWFEKALKEDLKVDTGYYYAQAQLWSEENPDAFAGIHNEKGVLVLFDEASGIPAPIWAVTDGFFTEPTVDRYQFAFSNPRRNTGEFYECFHKHANYWRRRHLDSRTVEGTDKQVLQQIVEKYGEDSDQTKVEVKGMFPNQGDKQFISREVIEDAMTRVVTPDPEAALIMGVDVARFGSDKSVIYFRKGRDARSIPPIKLTKKDNMEVANEIAFWINKTNPDAVCIDAGNGTGVIDRLREMGFKVVEVWFGSKSSEQEWANKRTEMWATCREWLKGAAIVNDRDLAEELAGPEYHFQGASDRIMLEAKENMKKRGVPSPDIADALCCTFAVKIASRDIRTSKRNPNNKSRIAKDIDYKIF